MEYLTLIYIFEIKPNKHDKWDHQNPFGYFIKMYSEVKTCQHMLSPIKTKYNIREEKSWIFIILIVIKEFKYNENLINDC